MTITLNKRVNQQLCILVINIVSQFKGIINCLIQQQKTSLIPFVQRDNSHFKDYLNRSVWQAIAHFCSIKNMEPVVAVPEQVLQGPQKDKIAAQENQQQENQQENGNVENMVVKDVSQALEENSDVQQEVKQEVVNQEDTEIEQSDTAPVQPETDLDANVQPPQMPEIQPAAVENAQESTVSTSSPEIVAPEITSNGSVHKEEPEQQINIQEEPIKAPEIQETQAQVSEVISEIEKPEEVEILTEQKVEKVEQSDIQEEDEAPSVSTVEFVIEEGNINPIQNEFTVMELSEQQSKERATQVFGDVEVKEQQEEGIFISLDYFLLGLSVVGLAATLAFVFASRK
eukprot:TRINITY_DN550_c0_g2_i2.p1 TRINITY_DN550_c0_g2~~TRINITY_DN550_c0_g2_i2.p1  ORF type:complete len:343 (+),score=56.29 TRINITY_DN550_c0_g2_i2:473-1501(+)